MPFPRGKKPSVTVGKIPKFNGKKIENQEDCPNVKRSSCSPEGAPKKRTAFVDITNAHKVHISLPGTKKKGSLKNTLKKSKNEAKLQKSESVSSESQEEEIRKAEETLVEDVVVVLEAVPHVDLPPHLQRPKIPEEFDIDAQHQDDPSLTAEYAKEIFDYLKAREEKFPLQDYMLTQPSLNSGMRAILVDWLVEVQENFELNHETLYLAVKITDHYLSTTPVNRESLQLIGSTGMLIASKFEERSPPCLDDFLYICDDAYKREELIAMEINIMQALSFDINIPIPYRFLRRYAKCVSASMETLTLARYMCELSLHEMDLVLERGSLLASACLLLALLTKDLGGWSPILAFHSGYGLTELVPIVRRLHAMLTSPPDDKLRAVRSKYSHKVFFEVATIPTLDLETLEKALQ
ncbi:hypothetical protein UPYG_G00235290 [Umbra pygmaea]|uniref:G2/mitotic-specific cyclin-B3 n=1 Tax=Umbra pygmaea TaxID=75934 RepID=A0ABD0WE64_UMBPY